MRWVVDYVCLRAVMCRARSITARTSFYRATVSAVLCSVALLAHVFLVFFFLAPNYLRVGGGRRWLWSFIDWLLRDLAASCCVCWWSAGYPRRWRVVAAWFAAVFFFFFFRLFWRRRGRRGLLISQAFKWDDGGWLLIARLVFNVWYVWRSTGGTNI